MNVDISAHVRHRMRALGISPQMVSAALNAPDRVRHLPLSGQRSFFCAFDERTIRVLTTLDDCVIAVSWAAVTIGRSDGRTSRDEDEAYPCCLEL